MFFLQHIQLLLFSLILLKDFERVKSLWHYKGTKDVSLLQTILQRQILKDIWTCRDSPGSEVFFSELDE